MFCVKIMFWLLNHEFKWLLTVKIVLQNGPFASLVVKHEMFTHDFSKYFRFSVLLFCFSSFVFDDYLRYFIITLPFLNGILKAIYAY